METTSLGFSFYGLRVYWLRVLGEAHNTLRRGPEALEKAQKRHRDPEKAAQKWLVRGSHLVFRGAEAHKRPRRVRGRPYRKGPEEVPRPPEKAGKRFRSSQNAQKRPRSLRQKGGSPEEVRGPIEKAQKRPRHPHKSLAQKLTQSKRLARGSRLVWPKRSPKVLEEAQKPTKSPKQARGPRKGLEEAARPEKAGKRSRSLEKDPETQKRLERGAEAHKRLRRGPEAL